MEVIVKCKRWPDSYRDTSQVILIKILIKDCLLRDGFFQIMCIASFNFKWSRDEIIISKQIPVLSALQVSLLTRCAKICDFCLFPNAP